MSWAILTCVTISTVERFHPKKSVTVTTFPLLSHGGVLFEQINMFVGASSLLEKCGRNVIWGPYFVCGHKKATSTMAEWPPLAFWQVLLWCFCCFDILVPLSRPQPHQRYRFPGLDGGNFFLLASAAKTKLEFRVGQRKLKEEWIGKSTHRKEY